MRQKQPESALADAFAVAVVSAVISALSADGICPSELQEVLPKRPGLYALQCDEAVLDPLGMAQLRGIPLYVGKAEHSVNSRDAKEHFKPGEQAGRRFAARSLHCLKSSSR